MRSDLRTTAILLVSFSTRNNIPSVADAPPVHKNAITDAASIQNTSFVHQPLNISARQRIDTRRQCLPKPHAEMLNKRVSNYASSSHYSSAGSRRTPSTTTDPRQRAPGLPFQPLVTKESLKSKDLILLNFVAC